jgi:hypothetical protein
MIHAVRSALRSGTSRCPMRKALFEYSNDETLLLALRLLSACPISWFLVSRYYQGNKSSLLHYQLRQLRLEQGKQYPHAADGPDKYLGSHLLLLQFFFVSDAAVSEQVLPRCLPVCRPFCKKETHSKAYAYLTNQPNSHKTNPIMNPTYIQVGQASTPTIEPQ